MKVVLFTAFFMHFIGGMFSFSTLSLGAAPPTRNATIERLIRGLDSNRYEEREEAEDKLKNQTARLLLPYLVPLWKSDSTYSLEQKVRLKRIGQSVLGGKDVPPELVVNLLPEQLAESMNGGFKEKFTNFAKLASALLDKIKAKNPDFIKPWAKEMESIRKSYETVVAEWRAYEELPETNDKIFQGIVDKCAQIRKKTHAQGQALADMLKKVGALTSVSTNSFPSFLPTGKSIDLNYGWLRVYFSEESLNLFVTPLGLRVEWSYASHTQTILHLRAFWPRWLPSYLTNPDSSKELPLIDRTVESDKTILYATTHLLLDPKSLGTKWQSTYEVNGTPSILYRLPQFSLSIADMVRFYINQKYDIPEKDSFYTQNPIAAKYEAPVFYEIK